MGNLHAKNVLALIPIGNGETRKIIDFVIHPDYKKLNAKTKVLQFKGKHYYPDIALVFFDGGLPNGFMPMNLPGEDLKLFQWQKIFSAGFGLTNINDTDSSGTLRNISTVIENPNFRNNDSFLVDNEQEWSSGSICYGDSGGPGFIVENGKNILVGVISRNFHRKKNSAGTTCVTAQTYMPSIIYHLNWISLELKKI